MVEGFGACMQTIGLKVEGFVEAKAERLGDKVEALGTRVVDFDVKGGKLCGPHPHRVSEGLLDKALRPICVFRSRVYRSPILSTFSRR